MAIPIRPSVRSSGKLHTQQERKPIILWAWQSGRLLVLRAPDFHFLYVYCWRLQTVEAHHEQASGRGRLFAFKLKIAVLSVFGLSGAGNRQFFQERKGNFRGSKDG